MKAHSEFKITNMCQMLEISKTAYYDWCGRPNTSSEKANELLTPLIIEIFKGQRRGCGTRTIKKALARQDNLVSRRRIARLMDYFVKPRKNLRRRRILNMIIRLPLTDPIGNLRSINRIKNG